MNLSKYREDVKNTFSLKLNVVFLVFLVIAVLKSTRKKRGATKQNSLKFARVLNLVMTAKQTTERK
jgi:hypothetical protein